MARYATVVLDFAPRRTFDYLIPASLAESVEPGMRVYVPFRSRRLSAYVISVSEGQPHPKAKAIISLRDRSPLLNKPLMKLAEWISAYYLCPLQAAISCILPSSVRRQHSAKMPIFVQLDRERLAAGAGMAGVFKRAPKQARILEVLAGKEGTVSLRELLREAEAPGSAVKALEKKGLVALTRERVYRDPWEEEVTLPSEHLPPTPEQARAIERAGEAVRERRFSVILLHGVTGSGKTEVYLQAIEQALKQGRGAIMLVPEISLTPQTVEWFKARFCENVAVLHSRLSAGERLDEWERLRSGRARVVVGARSAIFAPLPDLGLIVVDEEHERTYKQQETPRYHARDVAVMRGNLEGATIILGSATPSVESYWNASRGKYELFHLPRRIENRPLPEVTIVDMREEIKRTGRMTFLSRRLLGAVEDRMERGEQVILFLNRRGFSPFVICRRCGFVQKCPHCSVSLTCHREGSALLCHVCGFECEAQPRCPKCSSPNIRFPGIGTQKLELMVSRLFPGRRVARMDTDSMGPKHAHAETLRAFKKGEIQILVGTQMIAKGLHFPNVTLVGVVCADTALHLPDFRAAEHTFQLLTQVAGRAGRGEVRGEVIVQTFAPRHPAILAAGSQDYADFYRQEIAFREELSYPPVKRLVLVTLRGRHGEAVRWIGGQFAAAVREAAPAGIEVLGPAPSPIARAKGYYRWQLVIKGERVLHINELLRGIMESFKAAKNIQFVMDADPVSML